MPVGDDRWDLTRKWIARGESYEFDFDLSWFTGSKIQPTTLAELADQRLLVLLGEPGSGKTFELRREAARLADDSESHGRVILLDGHSLIHTESTLFRRWFDSNQWQSWIESDDPIWVIFDGFDESASKISNITGIIQSELGDLPEGALHRLFLRIGSRSTGWQESLDNQLKRLFMDKLDEVGSTESEADDPDGKDSSEFRYAFQLVPLSSRDVQAVAVSEGLDGKDFWQQLESRNIQALAARPAQLRWLIHAFRRDGTLPSSKAELYWEGIRQHAMPGDQPEEGDVYRAIAARMAFVWTFCGFASIWTAHDRGDVEEAALVLTSLAGGSERTETAEVQVDSALLRQTVASGLFTRINDQQVVWAHQTFPEFLAAHYCTGLALPPTQILGLITNPHDVHGKVIPGMTEVAAWLASMSSEVREYLLEHDPETLVESDVAMDSPESRRILLDAYLKAVDEQRALPDWRMGRGKYQKLYFDGMQSVIGDVISDTSRSWRTRDVAVDIALDCGLTALGTVLATIAVDSSEEEALRRSAAYAVVQVGDASARKMLKALLDLSPEADPYDDFRGQALAANWPDFLTVEEVLNHLGPPRWDGWGSYRQFLVNRFPASLGPRHLLPALNWFGTQQKWEPHWHEWESLEEGLMNKALQNLSEPSVFDWLVARVAENLADYRGLLGGSFARPREDLAVLDEPATRRDLITRLSRSTEDNDRIGSIADSLREELRSRSDWVDADFPWMVEQLWSCQAHSSEEKFWLSLVPWFACWSHRNVELAYELYLDSRFADEFSPMFRAITFDSEEAETLKRRHRMFSREEVEPEFTDNVDDLIRLTLELVDQGQTNRWWWIDHRLHYDEYRRPYSGMRSGSLPELNGWKLCSPLTQQWIHRTVTLYLEKYEPHVEEVGTNYWYGDDEAAFWALVWMAEEGQQRLAQLSEDAWRRLGPIILSEGPHTRHEADDKRHVLLEAAVEHGFDPVPWLRTMVDRAPSGESYYLEDGLSTTIVVLTDRGQSSDLQAIADALVQMDTPFEIAFCAVRVLFEHGYTQTFDLAFELASRLAPIPIRQSDAVRLITTIMSHLSPGQWGDLRSLLLAHKDLFDQVVLSFGYHDHDSRFLSSLTEEELKTLFEDVIQRFPRTEDVTVSGVHSVSLRESLGRWRDGILRHLSQRGTWEAVNQLQMLSSSSPAEEWLNRLVFEAEDAARLATLQPPTVDDLMALVRRPDKRLVTSAEQLQEVVLESLSRLQEELQAPTPAAESWWNYPRDPEKATPKEEEECSNLIKLHFERDLANRMVLTNREVKSRPKNVVDLLVEVMAPNDSGGADRISVVCEVKGCWNSDLMTSQESQLLKQYMQQEGYTHGVYIVAFFDGDRWESENRKSRHARNRRHSYESLSSDLDQQAGALSIDDKSVKSFVLNLNYEGGR